MILSIISAIGENREIGEKNNLLWNLPADMKHFKETTSGHVVIMGLKTFESIGRPLPNRRNIVLAQNYNIQLESSINTYAREKVIKPKKGVINRSNNYTIHSNIVNFFHKF